MLSGPSRLSPSARSASDESSSGFGTGILTADDEVALLHGSEEHGYRPMSVPLVNVRASLERGVADGIIDAALRDRVVEIARSIQYRERQVSSILSHCEHSSIRGDALERVRRTLIDGYVDVKKDDARELLRTVRRRLDEPLATSPAVPFDFNHSGGFDGLYNADRRVRRGGVDVSLQSIAEHVALYAPDFEELRASSLHRAICLFFASLVEVRLAESDLTDERRRFVQNRGLGTPEALEKWLSQNDMSHDDFEDFLREEAVCARLRRWILEIGQFDRGAKQLLDELRRRGRYPEWADRAAEEALTASYYSELPEYEPIKSQDPAALALQHGHRCGVYVTGDATAWSEERGFENVVGLEAALRRAVICQDVKDRIDRIRTLVAADDDAGARVITSLWEGDPRGE